MEENKKNNIKFISDGSLDQSAVNRVIEYLVACGMSDDDIEKVGVYKGWFHLNPLFDDDILEDDLKGIDKK